MGLIGCGFVGFRHATAVKEIAGTTELPVELVAVCDTRPERARAFAETFETRPLEDHRMLLRRPDVDVVYVCTATDLHLPLTREAAQAGKAVFCEKPLGRDLAEAGRVVEAVEQSGVPNQVGLVLRSSVVYLALRSYLPELGELMAVVFRDDQCWPLEAHYGSSWRGVREVVGSGTLLEHSIHDLDLVRWLFGEPGAVSAVVRSHAGVSGVEDAAVALLEIPDGPIVTLTSLWHDMAGRRSERYLEVFGRRGRVRVEADFWGELEWQDGQGEPRILSAEEVWDRAAWAAGFSSTERRLARLFPLEDYWFLRAVTEGVPPSPSTAEGLEAHRLVDRVYEAAGWQVDVSSTRPGPVV